MPSLLNHNIVLHLHWVYASSLTHGHLECYFLLLLFDFIFFQTGFLHVTLTILELPL